MAKKKMTIEDLARRMDKRFNNVNSRVDNVNSRVGLVEKNVNSRVDSIEKNINSRIDSVKEDLSKKIDKDTEFLARITQDGFKEAETKHNIAHRIIRKRVKANREVF